MKYRVLIVEDEPITLDIVSNILKNDYSILTANNGQRAYELYEKFNPHVLICDLKMPIMDGMELIKKIRMEDKNLKIIVTSFKDDLETLLKATELRLSKYLLKPIDSKELKRIVSDSINELSEFNVVSLTSIKIDKNVIWKKDEFELYHKDEKVKLTPKEKKVLDFLLSKPNKVLTYNEIIYSVWESNDEIGDRKSLKTIITGLRKKLEILSIENIYGFGYKINTNN